MKPTPFWGFYQKEHALEEQTIILSVTGNVRTQFYHRLFSLLMHQRLITSVPPCPAPQDYAVSRDDQS
jgi:hypothetical protein